jgi:hypothetical protein
MEKIQLTKEEYEGMIGLVSFDNDATEEFTPHCFEKFQKSHQPIFIIRPFKAKERDEYQKIVINLAKIDSKDSFYSEKIFTECQKLNRIMSKVVIDIKNLITITNEDGKHNYKVIEFEKEDGHIREEDLNRLSEIVKKMIFDRVNIISGLNTNGKASL